MSNNQLVTRELVDLKSKVMIQKIDKLYLICNMLFKNSEIKESKSLKVIKEQYLQMYNRLVETGQYEKYKEIEDIVIKEIAKVELNIDQHIYATIQSYQEVINDTIQKIYISRNYQDFNNLDQEIQHLGILNELLKLYSPYISKDDIEKTQQKFTKLKFDLLYRKQVEELICKNGGNNSNLLKYDNKIEKEDFEKLLEEKINSLKNKSVDSIGKKEDDELFKIPIEQVLSDSKSLERLIIIDMKKNPYNYINLVKAKVFNAHLCNIGSNPFEQEVYITAEQLRRLRRWGHFRACLFTELKANKVNYSILVALLKNIITDENVSYMDCENLYRKFGFECSPILINIGQQCVKMIVDEVKGSQEYINIINELDKKKENGEEQYCKIDFEGLVYKFENEDKDTDTKDLFDEVISKRNIKLSSSRLKRKKFFSKKEDTLQKRKEKIQTKGSITIDIDIIVLLINDIIEQLNDKIEQDNTSDIYVLKRYEKQIKIEQNRIQWLEDLKSKKEKLTLEDTRKLLFEIEDVYRTLGIRHKIRNIIPLEDMIRYELLPLAPSIPYDLRPLWKKYKREFIDLGIDVELISQHETSNPRFKICVNLADISDLPIDYEKVKVLTKEELQEIREREEGNER